MGTRRTSTKSRPEGGLRRRGSLALLRRAPERDAPERDAPAEQRPPAARGPLAEPPAAEPHAAEPPAAEPPAAEPHAAGPHAAGPPAAGPHAAGPHAAGPHAAGGARPADDRSDERRWREAGGPEDNALYTCTCGYVWEGAVSASVACPHCGTPQAW